MAAAPEQTQQTLSRWGAAIKRASAVAAARASEGLEKARADLKELSEDPRVDRARQSAAAGLQRARESASAGMERLQPGLDRARESAAEALDALQPGLDRARETVQPGLERVRESASAGIERLQPGLGRARDAVKETMERLADSARPFSQGVLDTLRARVAEMRGTAQRRLRLRERPDSREALLRPATRPGGLTGALARVAAFAGCWQTLGRMRSVCRRWRFAVPPPEQNPVCGWLAAVAGVPAPLRRTVWPALLALPPASQADVDGYAALVAAAPAEPAVVAQIWTDVQRAFGAGGRRGLADERAKAAAQQQLANILSAVAVALPDVGYCQGMDYVACHALFVLGDELTAFRVTRALLVDPGLQLHASYEPGLGALQRQCFEFGEALREHRPAAAASLERHGLGVELFLVGWLQTLFVYHPSLPTAAVDRIWDLLIALRLARPTAPLSVALAIVDTMGLAAIDSAEGVMAAVMSHPHPERLEGEEVVGRALGLEFARR